MAASNEGEFLVATLRLPVLAGFLAVPGIVALLLAGGQASARSNCAHLAAVYDRAALYRDVTVSVSEASVVNTYRDTVHVEWSLANEDPCFASRRSGYCLKVVVHGAGGRTHERCWDHRPRTDSDGFQGQISLGPAYWRLYRITAYARVGYGRGNYTSWSPGRTVMVRF